MNPVVSFIIPVYNGEKNISRCILSILSLDKYKYAIEVILVDDGSSDRTNNICKDIEKKDKRLKIICKKNGGVSSARNAGILKAEGKYIIFIDGDDEFLPKEFNELYSRLEREDEGVFAYNYLISDEMGKILSKDKLNTDNSASPSDIAKRYISYPILGRLEDSDEYLGGKVFQYAIPRKTLIEKGIRFDENIHFAEDMCFLFTVMQNVKVFKYVAVTLYKYYIVEGSASHSFRKKFSSELDIVFEYIKKIGKNKVNFPELELGIYNMKIGHYVGNLSLDAFNVEAKAVLHISDEAKLYLKKSVKAINLFEKIYKNVILQESYMSLYILTKCRGKFMRLKDKLKKLCGG